ncbi:hypothetical protein TSUD_262760 [Trifolium subterraneum]|nr:hypothetical protein TSUD_262760 [Trifolium subterraneum]
MQEWGRCLSNMRMGRKIRLQTGLRLAGYALMLPTGMHLALSPLISSLWTDESSTEGSIY